MAQISDLRGKTLIKITGMEPGSNEIHFECSDGTTYVMQHIQDCCESVDLEDVEGDVHNLIGVPLVYAEERDNKRNIYNALIWANYPEPEPTGADSETWTFYYLASEYGYVILRWYGCSNGYYSESVDFDETTPQLRR